MSPHPTDPTVPDEFWRPTVVYGMATVCLLLGLAIGYLVRGSESHPTAAHPAVAPSPPADPSSAQMPSLEQMKAMAEREVDPLLAQLKSDPNNKELLLRVAYFYKSAHQFKDAAAYFDRDLQLDPKNTAVRTEMASCLYYDGDVDGALAALQESLNQRPTDANSLFNLGMIRWKGKQDASGAIAAWKKLLKTNPNLDKKPVVERMIAEAQSGRTDQSVQDVTDVTSKE
jgi:cytochrome c-type biogenesis protein CcmH/NrfG